MCRRETQGDDARRGPYKRCLWRPQAAHLPSELSCATPAILRDAGIFSLARTPDGARTPGDSPVYSYMYIHPGDPGISRALMWKNNVRLSDRGPRCVYNVGFEYGGGEV